MQFGSYSHAFRGFPELPRPLNFKMAELSLEDSHKEEQLAEGILAILSPAVQQVDGRIGDVR